MDSILWNLRTQSDFSLSAPLVQSLFMIAILAWDHFFLLPQFYLRRLRSARGEGGRASGARKPSALVVIPSLLRKADELVSMKSTIESVATNGYSSELFVVVSIDGCADAPPLFEELKRWAASRH